jgi:KDO2-lipid IV(A) lauroyltransferase
VKYRPKHVAEYLLLRAVAGLIGILPYRAALAFACLLARIIYPFIGRKRREAVRRIRLVMGENYPLKAARRDAWISFRNTAFTAVEMIYLSRHDALPVSVDMADALTAFQAHCASHPGLGGIFACPHTGNWELAGIVAPKSGVNMFTITRDQKNPLVSRWLRQLRHDGEIELFFKGEPNLLRKVLGNLRKGKYLAMMPDLRSKTPGVPVRIFGGIANTYPGLGEFSVQAKVPVFLAVMRRVGWTHHTMTLHGPWFPDPAADKKAEASRLLQQVMDEIDRTVRVEPSQWFWYNSRWLLDPLPEMAAPSA